MSRILSISAVVSILLSAGLLSSCDGDSTTSSEGGNTDVGTPGAFGKSDFGIPWNSSIGYGSVTDSRDNQAYRTVQIGSQTWMAENLNFNPSPPDTGWCFGDQVDSCSKYGRLYTWATAMNLPDSCRHSNCASQIQTVHRGVCPIGWHVPGEPEWAVLAGYTGGESKPGRSLKSTVGWGVSGNGVDSFGFRAIAAGVRYRNGGYGWDGVSLVVWTSTPSLASDGLVMQLDSRNESFLSRYEHKMTGFSVRCLKD